MSEPEIRRDLMKLDTFYIYIQPTPIISPYDEQEYTYAVVSYVTKQLPSHYMKFEITLEKKSPNSKFSDKGTFSGVIKRPNIELWFKVSDDWEGYSFFDSTIKELPRDEFGYEINSKATKFAYEITQIKYAVCDAAMRQE